MKRLLMTVLLGVLASVGAAQAHTHLENAMPPHNAVLTAPPSQLMLHFSEASRLAALTIQKEGAPEPTAIKVLPKESAASLTIPLEPLEPAKYVVNWRAVGKDNHVMSGVLHFTVRGSSGRSASA